MFNPRRIRSDYERVGSPTHDSVVERRVAMMLELAVAPRLFGNASILAMYPLWAGSCKYVRDMIDMTARVRDKPHMYLPY